MQRHSTSSPKLTAYLGEYREGKKGKEEAVQHALKAATTAPLEIARYCLKAIDLLEVFKEEFRIASNDNGVVFCEP